MRHLLYIALFLHSSIFAAQVLRVGSSQKVIAVSHDDAREFKVKDHVCVFQGGKEVACGTVMKSSPKGAIVKLEAKSGDVVRGDIVRVAPVGRQPAMTLLDSVNSDVNTIDYSFNLAAGLGAGTSFFYPVVDFQWSLSLEFAMGIKPMFLSASGETTSVSAFGGFLTANYYGSDLFRGMWIQAGVGYLHFATKSVEIEESAGSLAFLTTFGWRGYWDLGLNVGIGAGLQYLQQPNINTVDIRSANAQPLVVLDIGFNF